MAHEMGTGALTLQEWYPGSGTLTFKRGVSTKGDISPLRYALAAGCTLSDISDQRASIAEQIETARFQCPQGLAGSTVAISGFQGLARDCLISVRFSDGSQFQGMASTHTPELRLSLPGARAKLPSTAFFRIGIEHILTGWDHLLFVLCMLLLWQRQGGKLRRLLQLVTGFTLAHSLTLGLSLTGWLKLPVAPVEILIALSIVFLARELLRETHDTSSGPDAEATSQRGLLPMVMLFGLFHGCGFASALLARGLEEAALGWSLFWFNLGVEAGQLMVILPLLLPLRWLWRVDPARRQPIVRVVVTLVGGCASYWLIERGLAYLA